MDKNRGITAPNMNKSYIRIMHAVPNAPSVDVYANDNLIAKNLAYGMYTDYESVPEGTYKVDVYATGTKEKPVITSMLNVGNDLTLTVAAVGTLDSIELLSIRDADVPMNEDNALIRFIHLSPNAPAVDITLPDGTVIFSNVQYKYKTVYKPVVPMVYTLQVRVAGTDNVVLTVPGVDVEEEDYYSIYAIGLVGEKPELEALLVQDGED